MRCMVNEEHTYQLSVALACEKLPYVVVVSARLKAPAGKLICAHNTGGSSTRDCQHANSARLGAVDASFGWIPR